MRKLLSLIQVLFICLILLSAKSHYKLNFNQKIKNTNMLELKYKKEISDKKISPFRKYTLAILAARDMKYLKNNIKAQEFYQIAKDIKVDENKGEIIQAFYKKQIPTSDSVFFYEVNLKSLIINRFYEKAILSLNPDKFKNPEYISYKIIYDLLNSRIRKRNVHQLYCLDDYQKNPEDYQYSHLLCDLLIDYHRDGILGQNHFNIVEEYFLKQDLKEIYLLRLAKELKSSP